MKKSRISETLWISLIMVALSTTLYAGKPLKIFIMSGQSNMEGYARVRTIERLTMTDDGKQLYEDMKVKDGLPSAVEGAYAVYFNGDAKTKGNHQEMTVKMGPLKPGFSSNANPETTFGPEYTFGIYMQKHLKEPILIIKAAWGGRNLMHSFRPPSAGPLQEDTDNHGNPVGHYYNLILKRVEEVLADPSKYHPAYNKADGYEIAGFVWFQGYNDMVGKYPLNGKTKDYSEYSRIQACFIRDLRKDLKAPEMPFVYGVMGIDGVVEDENSAMFQFRKAQAATAEMPEFQGNVVAVHTDQYWDKELQRIEDKFTAGCLKEILAKDPDIEKKRVLLTKRLREARRELLDKVLTPEEIAFRRAGSSNAAFHYMGSAYTYGNIGKGFAEAMASMMK